MRYSNKRFNLATALLCASGLVSAAEASLLPLESGTYVVLAFEPCNDAPLAAVMTFDGKSFSGPHESDCTSSVTGKQNTTYEVATQCRAAGNGTPVEPTTTVMYLRIKSPTHLVKLGQGRDSDYELCPTFH